VIDQETASWAGPASTPATCVPICSTSVRDFQVGRCSPAASCGYETGACRRHDEDRADVPCGPRLRSCRSTDVSPIPMWIKNAFPRSRSRCRPGGMGDDRLTRGRRGRFCSARDEWNAGLGQSAPESLGTLESESFAGADWSRNRFAITTSELQLAIPLRGFAARDHLPAPTVSSREKSTRNAFRDRRAVLPRMGANRSPGRFAGIPCGSGRESHRAGWSVHRCPQGCPGGEEILVPRLRLRPLRRRSTPRRRRRLPAFRTGTHSPANREHSRCAGKTSMTWFQQRRGSLGCTLVFS